MNMIIKKRQLVTATLIIALGAAVFVNWYYTKPEAQKAEAAANTAKSVQDVREADNLGDAQYVIASGNSDGKDLFAQSELNRKKAHDEAAELFQKIIKDESSSETAVKEASEKLAKLSEQIKLEADVETLISAKTGKSCLVIIDDESAQVIVPPGILNDTVTVQIKDIILNKTGFSSKNITIVELKG
jgi:stage III sporulation protein AH